MKKEKLYYTLVEKVKAYGIRSDKRHGDYYTLNVFGKWRLVLDTWNKSIYVYDAGLFRGSLGIDFGGFDCDLPMVRFWIGMIKPSPAL